MSDLEMCHVTSDCLYVWLGSVSGYIRLFVCLTGKCIRLHQIICMSDWKMYQAADNLLLCLNSFYPLLTEC